MVDNDRQSAWQSSVPYHSIFSDLKVTKLYYAYSEFLTMNEVLNYLFPHVDWTRSLELIRVVYFNAKRHLF